MREADSVEFLYAIPFIEDEDSGPLTGVEKVEQARAIFEELICEEGARGGVIATPEYSGSLLLHSGPLADPANHYVGSARKVLDPTVDKVTITIDLPFGTGSLAHREADRFMAMFRKIREEKGD